MEKVICKKFCAFYKPGKKEEMKCGSYNFLLANYTGSQISSAAGRAVIEPDFDHDSRINELVCAQCDFLVDGCDYRDGIGKTPCGGYAIVEQLLSKEKEEA